VLGERDQPLSGVPVSVLREGSLAGHETFAAEQGTSWTDDRGGYVFSVLPGEYVVAARINMSIGNRETPRAIDPSGRTLVYRTTFYPNMQSPADATRIALRAGDDRSGVNLRLTAEPGFDITGTVTGAGDLNDLWITLSQAADHDSTSTGASPERRYAFQSIRAGTYALRAGKWPEMPSVTHGVAPLVSLPTAPTLWADAQVVITDRPMDVPLQLREGVRISGRIEFDGATSPPSLDVLNKRALVIDRADGEYSDFRGLYLANDRFTTIQLPPGRYLARPQPPEGWYLQSVMAAGRDIATAPLDVGTADIGDVVITFADRPARLTGRVMFERTDRPQRAWVTIFPVDRSLWIDHGRSPRAIQTILTGVSGEYVAELPSGRYYVIATEDAIGNAQTPGVFTALSASATTVTVTDRSTTRQDVRVQRGRR
jgi:hypothetical protein